MRTERSCSKGVRRSIRLCMMLIALFSMMAWPGGLAAEESVQHTGKVIWEAEFTEQAFEEHWTTGHWTPSPGEKGKRTMEVKDGNMILTSTFPQPPGSRGYASFWYHFQNGWGLGFPLQKAPVLEVRWRRLQEEAGSSLILCHRTFGGQASSGGVGGIGRRVPVGKWTDLRLNLYEEPEVAGGGGMELLQRFSFFLFSEAPAGEAVSIEIDYVRLRQMTAEEWESANRYLEPLREFKMQPCPRAENFFGFGFWGLWNPRWGGGQEVCLDHMARHWVNMFVPLGSRFGDGIKHGWSGRVHGYTPERSLEENLVISKEYLKGQRELLELLKPYGMSYLLDMHYFPVPDGWTLKEMKREQLELWADAVTSALRDEESILGWLCGSEVRPAYLKKFLVAKELLESRDRSKVATVLVNGMNAAEAFAPQHQVMVSDKYPVLRPNRDDPWRIAWWMDEVRRVSGDKPHWIILQAFSGSGEKEAPLATRPHPVEFRMMSYLAAAGGADVFAYFLYSGSPWWHTPYVRREPFRSGFLCMVDEYGNHLPWFDEYAAFADKVGPLGGLIPGARVVEAHGLEVTAPKIRLDTLRNLPVKGPRERKAIHLGVMRPREMDALLVLAVNMDRENEQEVKIIGTDQATSGWRLYDLVSLEPVDRSGVVFNCGTLAPGDGHPFALATEREFEKIRENIYTAKARQALRVAELDVRKAERWGIDAASMRQDIEKARQMMADRPADALEQAQSASQSAESALQAHRVYSQAAPLLQKAQETLGRIEIMLNLSVHKKPEEDPRTEPVGKRVVELSERFSALKRQLYFGEAEGLVDGARELVPQVEEALGEVSEVTGVSVSEPLFRDRPWRHPEWFD